MISNIDAIILIDVQNTCVFEQYEFRDWELTTKKCRQILPNIKNLVNLGRKKDIEIIHILTEEWVKEKLPYNINKLYNENPKATFYSKGLPESLIDIKSNEKVFRKNTYSAWGVANGRLSKYLKKYKNPSLIIAGFYSTGCVNSTIIEGFSNGIFWYIPLDCTETFDRKDKQDYQKFLIEEWSYNYGHTKKSYKFLEN